MNVITDERCTAYAYPGHPERPARITQTLELLRRQKELPIKWGQPAPLEEKVILRAHSGEFVEKVKTTTSDFDGDTPLYPHLFEHASRSVGAALQAMNLARKGEAAFSLIRPPGHHATQDRAMGFCYFNSLAIALLEAMASGTKRVAVYDFDVHHGNGTEAILLDRPNTLFISIHQYPCYPGSGAKNRGANCLNYPVPPQTPHLEYRRVLEKALGELAKFKPELVGISAGFDSYARDPLAQETLELEDYHWLGESFRKLGIPCFSVLEGGYSTELPELILGYLKGLAG